MSSTPSAFANIYRINLDNYFIDPAVSNVSGSLSGFIVIDESLVGVNDPDYNRSTFAGPIAIPNWITAASITWTNNDPTDVNNPSITKTMHDASFPLDEINWRVKASTVANGGTFDPSQEFTAQMDTFGLANGIQFTGNPNGGFTNVSKMVQQFYQSEGTLQTPVSAPVAVPGPLPVLGLIPLAWYFRKFKKNSI